MISVVTDIYRGKVYNKFIILSFFLSIANHFVFLQGISSLKMGLFVAIIAFFIMLPLYVTKMLGGGDLKLFVVLALNLTIASLLNTFIFSLVWGLVLGVVMIISKNKVKSFFSNILGFLTLNRPEQAQLHTIPYTVAIFLGWLTHLSLRGFSFI